jgi:hypothetical protein
MSNITFDHVSATVTDPPAAPAAAAARPDADRHRDYDRVRLDDLLRQRAQREQRIAAD